MTVDGGRPAAPSGGAGRATLLAIRFASELALLAVLAVAGARADAGLPWRIVLAVAGPVVVAVIWGRLMAPRARRRLRDPLRLAAETVIFLAAAAALAATGPVIPAAVFAVLAVGAALLARLVAPEP